MLGKGRTLGLESLEQRIVLIRTWQPPNSGNGTRLEIWPLETPLEEGVTLHAGNVKPRYSDLDPDTTNSRGESPHLDAEAWNLQGCWQAWIGLNLSIQTWQQRGGDELGKAAWVFLDLAYRRSTSGHLTPADWDKLGQPRTNSRKVGQTHKSQTDSRRIGQTHKSQTLRSLRQTPNSHKLVQTLKTRTDTKNSCRHKTSKSALAHSV